MNIIIWDIISNHEFVSWNKYYKLSSVTLDWRTFTIWSKVLIVDNEITNEPIETQEASEIETIILTDHLTIEVVIKDSTFWRLDLSSLYLIDNWL